MRLPRSLPVRRRPARLASLVLVPALLLSAPLAAQQVYKWKDASGVTHFTSEPPPEGNYETREVDHHRPAPPTAATATSDANDPAAGNDGVPAKRAPDPGCATARSNLALLAGDGALTMDADGDGKAEPLSADDRARQRTLAQAVIDAKCGGNAAAPAAGAEEP